MNGKKGSTFLHYFVQILIERGFISQSGGGSVAAASKEVLLL
jgi:hypothetical protein